MKDKRRLHFFLLIAVAGSLIFLTFFLTKANQAPQTPAEQRSEQIILAYIKEKNLNINLGTEEFMKMMKGILLGEYPDLTGENSPFVKTASDRDNVIEYAATHMKGGN